MGIAGTTNRGRGRYAAALGAVVVLCGCAGTGDPRALPEDASRVPSGFRAPPDAQRVEVTGHVDGDTIRVRARQRGVLPRGVETTVRLLEIDAPETRHHGQPAECLADEASAELARLLPVRETGWVLRDRDLFDRYGRTLVYVWTERGVFVNRELVGRGLATAELHEPNHRFIGTMRAAQSRARRDARGMWGAC